MRKQSAKTKTIHADIDPKLKKTTVAAMREANRPAAQKRYRSFRELREQARR